MLHWISHLVNSLNYWGVAILMAIENVVLPVPSELIMPLAGFRTVNGRLSLLGVILSGTVGSVLGALPLYYVGYALGEERLKKWLDRHGRWMMLGGRDLDRASRRFTGNQFVAVTIAQIVPGARGLISLPAGVARMNVFLFLAANFIGTVVWCAALAIAGTLLGRHFTRIHKFLGPIGWVILGFVLAAGIVWVIRHKRRRTERAR